TATNNCTVGLLQNPNLAIYCDDFNPGGGYTIPRVVNFRLNGSYQLPWQSILVSAALQSNDGLNLAQSYTVTKTTRYPDGSNAFLVANQPAPACPSPCTAGALVLSTLNQASQAIALRPAGSVRGERLNQLDIKIG